MDEAAPPDPVLHAQAVLDAMPWQAAIVDRQGIIRRTNRRWVDVNLEHGIETDDVGADYFAVCDGARRESPEAERAARLIRAILDGEQPTGDLEYPCHSPREPHWFVMRVTPVHDDTGQISGVLLSHQEITAQREFEHDLRSFVAHAAHDLRTPLRHLANFPELLANDLDATLSDTHRRWLDTIRRAAEHMRSQVDNLLALARSRLQPLDFTVVDMPRLLEERLATLGQLLGIESRADTSEFGRIVTDGKLMAVLVENVVANALKHAVGDTPLVLKGSGGPSDAGFVLHFDDNGPGFGEIDTERLFRPFERGQKTSGMGLGLSIVNQVAQRLGGHIELGRAPLGGARVSVHLPPRRPGREALPDDPHTVELRRFDA